MPSRTDEQELEAGAKRLRARRTSASASAHNPRPPPGAGQPARHGYGKVGGEARPAAASRGTTSGQVGGTGAGRGERHSGPAAANNPQPPPGASAPLGFRLATEPPRGARSAAPNPATTRHTRAAARARQAARKGWRIFLVGWGFFAIFAVVF